MIMSVTLEVATLIYSPSVTQGQGSSQTQALPSEGASSFLRLAPPHSFQSDRKQGGRCVRPGWLGARGRDLRGAEGCAQRCVRAGVFGGTVV